MSKKLQYAFSIVAILALFLGTIGIFTPRIGDEVVALSGAVAGESNFSQLGVGFDAASDYQITFYGNAQDYYVGLDDSADDLIIGLGSVVGTTPALGIDENLAVTTYGDLTFGGTTPVLTIGDGGEEDPTLLFDGNADDFYVAIDDTVDDLMIGYGSAVGTDPKLTFVDSATTTEIKVGDATENDMQFTFDGNAQDFYLCLDDTADDFLIGLGAACGTTPGLGIDENLAVATYGDVTMGGTTPVLTVGDAAEEDAALVFDGNAQDFYVALDDTADDLLIGLGSAVGTTPGLAIDENLAVTTYGDFTMGGTTPVLTVGDAGAEDAALVFDGNQDDFYLSVYDTADDFVLGYGSTIGTDARISVVDSADTTNVVIGDAAEFDMQVTFDGNAQDWHIALDDTADDLIIGLGAAIETTEYMTFLDDSFVISLSDAGEQDSGFSIDGNAQDYYMCLDDTADDFLIGLGAACGTTPGISIDENLAVGTYGDVTMTGTTPVLTLGDADEEDAALVFDGNAQDFYVGLDDTADDLVIGLGSALGTTAALSVDENQVTTFVGGSLQLFETVTAANVLDATECGKTMVINSATEFETDLPAVSGNAGCFFRFIVGAAPSGASYTIVTNSSENVLYGITHEADDVAAGPVGAGADTLTNTNGQGAVGDWIEFFCDGTYWFYVAWVDNGTGWEPSTAG